MADDANRFRDRAVDCRQLAKTAKLDDAAMLRLIAAELDDEADKIDAREAATRNRKASDAPEKPKAVQRPDG